MQVIPGKIDLPVRTGLFVSAPGPDKVALEMGKQAFGFNDKQFAWTIFLLMVTVFAASIPMALHDAIEAGRN